MTPQQLLCKVLIDTNILIDYLEECDSQKALIIFDEINKYQEHMVHRKNVSIKRANSNANLLKD